MFMLKCESCGKEFLSVNPKSKFCKEPLCIDAKHEYLKKIGRERMKVYYNAERKDKLRNIGKKSSCLCCGDEFIAYGKFNKLCKKCKEKHSRYNGLCEVDFSGGFNIRIRGI
jgi:hypothetical protein